MSTSQGIRLGLIPARAGSKGIPLKNLMKIGGKELVRLAVEVGRQVPELDLLICSTDGERIAEVARDAGAQVPFMRPAELAGDTTPTLPVIEHAILEVERMHGRPVSNVVSIDPTAPLRTPQDVRDAIAFYDRNQADLVVSVHRGHANPYFNMLEEVDGYFCIPKGAEMNYGSRQAAPVVYHINTVVWIYSRRAVMEERVRIPRKTLIYEYPTSRGIDIDTPDDVRMIDHYRGQAER